MRLGVVYDPDICPYYRAIDPMRAMEQRGHEVVWPDASGRVDLRQLRECDVVHVYRLAGAANERAIKAFVNEGTPITYDNDDDRAALTVAERGGRRAGMEAHRVHVSTVKIARMARRFTTPTGVLADLYRRAGVNPVEVIENYLAPDLERPRPRHDGIVIGWMAGKAHESDAARLGIAKALSRLVEQHAAVRVVCIGVNLNLPERYTHHPWVRFEELPRHLGGFDLAIAPLVESAVNRARSNIKLKEYAASGVPWLASPVGPYADLGEDQGGHLVADDEWFEALDRLVTAPRLRRRLARKGRRWAKRQTIDQGADRWERVFVEAAG